MRDQVSIEIAPRLSPTDQGNITLLDGRRLGWSTWGPADGKPVIFCTGAGMSGSLTFAETSLADLGIQMIALDPPGLGRSTDHPAGTLETWGEDVGEFVERSALHRPLAVGFSQGAPFALQLGILQIVDAVAVVSGQDDPGCSAIVEQLDPQVLGMLASLRRNPEAFRHEVTSMASAEWLWTMIMKMSSKKDREVYASGRFADPYRRCLDEGFITGPSAYSRDLCTTWSPWPFQLEDMPVPVDLWYGLHDASPVHSPDMGRTMAARIPRSRLYIEKEEGGSLLWTMGDRILGELLSHVVRAPR